MAGDQGDLAAILREAIADLDGYIEREAEKRAAPKVERVVADTERLLEAAGREVQRWKDCHAERGRRIEALERQQTIGLATLQFEDDRDTVHLVRRSVTGTPGPTLCDIERHGSRGWSVGGGVTGPDAVHEACPGCMTAAETRFPCIPICRGIGAGVVAARLGRVIRSGN
jgi:hypothetical protein